MKNILKLIVLSLFIFSCTDKSANNIGDMTLEEYAKSDKFISFTDEEVKYLWNDTLVWADTTLEGKEIIFKGKAASYRFYKKCTFDKSIISVNVKKGKDINISQNFFKELKRNIDSNNEFVRSTSAENPATAKDWESKENIFTEEFLEKLIEK